MAVLKRGVDVWNVQYAFSSQHQNKNQAKPTSQAKTKQNSSHARAGSNRNECCRTNTFEPKAKQRTVKQVSAPFL